MLWRVAARRCRVGGRTFFGRLIEVIYGEYSTKEGKGIRIGKNCWELSEIGG